MKPKRSEKLADEVSELLEQVTFEEASLAVWKKFEEALSQLDKSGLELLQSHFSGESLQTLSRSRNLSEDQIRTWINQLKRQLIQQLRKDSQPKN